MSESITVEPVEGYSALKMTWPVHPTEEHVRVAFEQIVAYLNAAQQTVHVIVDLRSDPNIPVTYTFHHVVQGPFNHDRMGNWLVIGKNPRAELVSRLMNVIRRRDNILWFDTEDQAMDKLRSYGT